MPLRHHRLCGLGWTPDDVRRALQNQGVTVAPPVKNSVYKSNHVRTAPLCGPAQRQREASLDRNQAWLVGQVLRGIPVRHIAVACMVTEVAIYNRLSRCGVQPPSVRRRKLVVNRKPVQHAWLIIEEDYDDSYSQPAAAQR